MKVFELPEIMKKVIQMITRVPDGVVTAGFRADNNLIFNDPKDLITLLIILIFQTLYIKFRSKIILAYRIYLIFNTHYIV